MCIVRRRTFTMGIAAIATAGSLNPAKSSLPAAAPPIIVLTSVALTSALNELAPQFEHISGDKVSIGYSLIADIRKRVLNGETADVIMLSQPVMDELQQHGKIIPGSIINVAGTEVAVAVRAGAPKPDISTVAAFKRALLAANSVVYADPARGGASGVYFAHVLDRLGIAEQMKPKTVLVPGAQAAEFVAEGKVELGIGQTSEIMPVAGAQLVGPFPAELASTTVFAAGIGVGSKETNAANALIKFLTGPVAASVFRKKGFQPG
jgi:molybdate transport system substrate-binding protein